MYKRLVVPLDLYNIIKNIYLIFGLTQNILQLVICIILTPLLIRSWTSLPPLEEENKKENNRIQIWFCLTISIYIVIINADLPDVSRQKGVFQSFLQSFQGTSCK